MPSLIEHVLKRNDNRDIKIKSAVLGDGSCDSNENFKYLQTKKIMPGIKVRKNSIISTKNNKIRNKEKFGFKQKRSTQMEEEKDVWKKMDG